MSAQPKPVIGVNLLWLVPGVVGGSEEYTTRLLAGLAERRPEDFDVALFVLRPFAHAYRDLVAAFPTDVAPITGRSKALRVLAESTWLPRHARRRGVTVMHHAGGTLPVRRTVPGIVTIHDLQPLLVPESFSVIKRTYLRFRLPPSARHARLVTVPSETVRRSVVDRLGVEAHRVAVVHPGIPAPHPERRGDEVARRYGIDAPFFLYPAITYPHKNHVVLVRAFAEVAARRPDVLLVLTGGAAGEEATVAAEIDRRGIRSRVRRLGRVPSPDVHWLFAHALALAFPSKFEGFGLPVLEAMAAGCPVVVADSTSLPDVVDTAGVLVPPDDAGAWTEALLHIIDDPEERNALAAAGCTRAAEFTPAAAAHRLANAYRRALA